MFFHLIGIKEKNGKQYELDFLIKGGDENFIRDFLSNRGVVIVSLLEYKDNPKNFGNVTMSLMYNNAEVQLLMPGEDLSERLYFVAYLGLAPQIVNFVDKPIPEVQMADLIKSTFIRIKEESEKIKQQAEAEIIKEKKKYQESNIGDALKIINTNIDRIQQVMKAGDGILSGTEMKQLEDYSNEMKKIRLGTNFNKMATLVLEAHSIVHKAEEKIFKAYDDQKFLIDKNSTITNIDVIAECFHFNKISEKALFQPSGLNTTESMYNMLKSGSIFMRLLGRDISYTFEHSNFDQLFATILESVEYIILAATIIISFLRLIAPLLGITTFSLYLLPIVGWLGLLIYLFNSLITSIRMKTSIKVIGFIILAIFYRYGLKLLLNTFAL